MNINAILKIIDEEQAINGLSDYAMSKRIGKSTELIRNWRRRARNGEGDAGVNTASLEALKAALAEMRDTPNKKRSSSAPESGRGFAESAIQEWQAGKDPSIADLIRFLAPDARHPSPFLLGRPMPQFDFCAGDILIIESNGHIEPGQLVIGNLVDVDLGTAETVIGRYAPPYIVPANTQDMLLDIQKDFVSILGPVVASFRSSQIPTNQKSQN